MSATTWRRAKISGAHARIETVRGVGYRILTA
jgi:DNA-binding response OmpR family regulator